MESARTHYTLDELQALGRAEAYLADRYPDEWIIRQEFGLVEPLTLLLIAQEERRNG